MEAMLKEEIKGWFYPQQVQKVKVNPRKRYTIEKILKYHGKGSKKEALIKWIGYGEKFNTWEPYKNLAGKSTIHKPSKYGAKVCTK